MPNYNATEDRDGVVVQLQVFQHLGTEEGECLILKIVSLSAHSLGGVASILLGNRRHTILPLFEAMDLWYMVVSLTTLYKLQCLISVD
jgi:hypothetical protein